MTDVLATFAGYSAGARYNGAGMSIASTGRGNDHKKWSLTSRWPETPASTDQQQQSTFLTTRVVGDVVEIRRRKITRLLSTVSTKQLITSETGLGAFLSSCQSSAVNTRRCNRMHDRC